MAFKLFEDKFLDEKKYRQALNIENLCSYGIKPLDDACKCILPDDLVVIGATSGAGKTELSLHIAQHNAQRGKRVALYHLEGSEYEPIQRMTWRDLCRLYFNNHSDRHIKMDYMDWLTNKIDPFINELEGQVYAEYCDKFAERFFIFERGNGLTLTKFRDSLSDFTGLVSLDMLLGMKEITSAVKGINLDLIVIDHLQYFSLTNPMNELQEVSEILQTCNDIATSFKIPIILVSHLRKGNKERGMPSQDDFHGTSNIAKKASTAITLMPDYCNHDNFTMKYPTYIRVCKSRFGLNPNIVIRGIFDGTTRKYDDEYQVHKIDNFGMINTDPMDFNALPHWAKQGVGQEYVKYTPKKEYTDI